MTRPLVPLLFRPPLARRASEGQTIPRSRVGLTALALILVLGRAAVARADLDPEVNKPYDLRVVLDVAQHRLLTPTFIGQLERELRGILQADLGDLARVTVLRTHPLLEEIRAKGLEKALDGDRKVTDHKTHFVLLRYVGGHYRLQARQHDGLTGLSSPLVRRSETTDPRLVARNAALLVDQDFGLVGTVRAVANGQVDLAVKGAGLGVPLKRWLDVGQVFAVAAVSKGADGLRSTPLEWAFLQVVQPPQAGVCKCRYYHRLRTDSLDGQPDVLGYRCLRLTTVTAPLRLRFLDFKTHEPHDSLQVHVGAAGFDGVVKKLATDREGLMPRTGESYTNVAFVRVLSGGQPVANIPVVILGDRVIDCLVSINPEAEEKGQKEMRRDAWLRRIYDSLRVAADRVTALNELGKKSLRQEALARAEEGLRHMEADLKSLTEERERLKKQELDVAEGEQRLDELEKRKEELQRFATRLAKLIKEEKDPRRQEMLGKIERARLLETQAEFGQAVELYEKVLADFPKETNVRKRLEELKKAWAVKSKRHAEARAYVYDTWAKLTDPTAILQGLAKAQAALEVCRDAGDALTPQKILRADVALTDTLKKRVATLRPQAREDDRKEAATIAKAAEGLKRLHQAVLEYLKKAKPAFP